MAETVGEEYGRRLAAQMSTGEGHRSFRVALHAIADALTAHGFEAHAEARGGSLALIKDACPFFDTAKQHPVICAVDRGMVRGMLCGLYGEAVDPDRVVAGARATTPASAWSDRRTVVSTGRPAYLDHASTSIRAPGGAGGHGAVDQLRRPGPGAHRGRMARVALEDARDRVATLFGTRSRQVIFTSGATEAINAAVFGALGGSVRHPAGPPASKPTGEQPPEPWWPLGSSTAQSEKPPSVTGAASLKSPWTGRADIDVDDLREALRDPDVVLVQLPVGQP